VSELDPFVSTRMQRSETAAALTEANDLFATGRADEARRKLSERLDSVKRQRDLTVARAPAAAKPKLEKDLEEQSAALGQANTGFEAAPPAPGGAARPSPAEDRKGKSQVKQNSVKALDFGM